MATFTKDEKKVIIRKAIIICIFIWFPLMLRSTAKFFGQNWNWGINIAIAFSIIGIIDALYIGHRPTNTYQCLDPIYFADELMPNKPLREGFIIGVSACYKEGNVNRLISASQICNEVDTIYTYTISPLDGGIVSGLEEKFIHTENINARK